MANENRLIDANKAQAVLMNMAEHLQEAGNPEMAGAVGYAAEVIGKQPTVDAVEVVRCRDCQHWNKRYETKGICLKHNSIVTFTSPDFYCACGERKSDGICKKG